MDWAAIRAQFPALQTGITFLDTASFGQLPERTTAAVSRHFAHRDEDACHDFLGWFDDADRTRAAIAALVHGAPGDIAFVPNTATALATLIGGIEFAPGDEVMVPANEFPNNVYAAAMLGRRGAVLRECPWDQLDSALSERTRLVLMSTVSYTTGFRPPLSGFGARLRDRGIHLFVDGTQSVGALELDVTDVQPTMLAVHGYKWLLCPNGAGFAWIPPETRAWLEPTVIGWRSHRNWRNVDNLHHGQPELPAAAEKYEGGMLPFALIYAMDASVNLLREIGPSRIEARVLELASELRAILRRRGAAVPEYDSQIVTARFPNADAVALRRALDEQRIYVSARHGSLRVSAHFYNNEADLARFDGALGHALG